MRERADNRQHRAFARFGDGLARLQRTEVDGRRQRAQRQATLAGQRFADTLQELGEDRSRIAARAVDRFARHALEDRADVRSRHGPQRVAHAGQGKAEIAAGIAVGDRKDIDPVEQVALGKDPTDAGDQCLLERASIGIAMAP